MLKGQLNICTYLQSQPPLNQRSTAVNNRICFHLWFFHFLLLLDHIVPSNRPSYEAKTHFLPHFCPQKPWSLFNLMYLKKTPDQVRPTPCLDQLISSRLASSVSTVFVGTVTWLWLWDMFLRVEIDLPFLLGILLFRFMGFFLFFFSISSFIKGCYNPLGFMFY